MNSRFSILVFVAVAGVGLVALYRLLALEFETGDAFPEFSSYRPDPLGLLVLHEAVASLPGPAPSRNIVPLDSARFPERATLLLAGAMPSPDPVKTLERLEQFVAGGGRLVILFRSDTPEWRIAGPRPADDNDEESDEDEKEEEESARDDMLEALNPMQEISERWGFRYQFRRTLDAQGEARLGRPWRDSVPALPGTITWHSGMVFTDLAPEWTEVFNRESFPVVVERPWGEGSIVLATDNFSVTNEAMRHDRTPGYVSWLIGEDRPLVFEETHLGVAKRPGVMALIRRYRLFPVLIVSILLLGLYIWRNVASLVPRMSVAPPTPESDERGFSTVAGIANLARRAVPPKDVLAECWSQYQQSADYRSAATQERKPLVEGVLQEFRETPRRKRNIVAVYNEMHTILNQRSSKP